MPLYESTFITRQDMSKQDVNNLADAFGEIVKKGGGSIVKNEYWGLKNLAYKINKSRKGHYTMLAIDAPAAAVKELERNMGINEDVIRSLTIRVEEIEEGPSVMLNQNKRDESYGDSEVAEAVAATQE
ncbi:MAG: 30S ribosomal protein S6 [Alphaproteobacteria bacterium]|nr:30S ribosomal protein S6 [Alphaproteobacteria bacterium]